MTATTLTPATTAAELLDTLRHLLDRHDGAATLDEARAIADELTVVLRRARRRIGRITRHAERTEAVEAPTPAAEATPTPPPVTEPERAEPPASAAEPQQARMPELLTTRVTPIAARPAVRRVTTIHVALAMLAVGWATGARGVRRAIAAVRSAVRRRGPAEPAMPLPRPGDAPPIGTMRRSPLDIAAGLQVRKGQAYADYQATVLQWEIGTRAYQSATAVNVR